VFDRSFTSHHDIELSLLPAQTLPMYMLLILQNQFSHIFISTCNIELVMLSVSYNCMITYLATFEMGDYTRSVKQGYLSMTSFGLALGLSNY